jgi:hypothetical protein
VAPYRVHGTFTGAGGKHVELAAIHERAGIRELILNEALVLAARTGKVEVCSYLLALGANPSHVGYGNRTAREFAEQEGRSKVIPLLPAAGAADETAADARHALDGEIRHLLMLSSRSSERIAGNSDRISKAVSPVDQKDRCDDFDMALSAVRDHQPFGRKDIPIESHVH